MAIPLDAPEVLNREFPEIRARLLQLAAALDRMDRAAGSPEGDSRRQKIRDALAILVDKGPDRAERLQPASRTHAARLRPAAGFP